MKNILICVSGLTPQIITETLFALSIKQKIKFDEIVIVTTSKGEDIINGVDKDFNEGFGNKRNYPSLRKVLNQFYSHYKKNKYVNPNSKLTIINAREESLNLNDVRNDKENILFPNKLIEIFKKYTAPEKENILHCSLSGGRKTMSVDMALAISIFGRENDKLYHVLVDESVEFKNDFWFPKTKKEEKLLEISEKPYIRLRPILGEITENKIFSDMNFMDIVNETQEILKKKSVDKLYISIATKMMVYGEFKPVSLEPIQIKLYRFLKENSSDGKRVKLETIVDYIKAENQKINKLYGIDNIRTLITKLNIKISNAIPDSSIVDLFKISSGGYGSAEVFIAASAKDIDIS